MLTVTACARSANLSDIYFTNRQDRYIKFTQNAALADFYAELFAILRDCPLASAVQASSEARLQLLEPAYSTVQAFVDLSRRLESLFAARAIDSVTDSAMVSSAQTSVAAKHQDTLVFPSLQFPAMGIRHDEQTTLALLAWLSKQSSVNGEPWHLTVSTGYLNFASSIQNALLDVAFGPSSPPVISNSDSEGVQRSSIRVVAAGESANGWFGGSGKDTLVPRLYSALLKQLSAAIEKRRIQEVSRIGTERGIGRVWLLEYERTGWTYHAKGLWLFPATSNNPICSAIGSPNLGITYLKATCCLVFAPTPF